MLLFKTADLGDRKQFEAAYGRQPNLPAFIRSLVGMDRSAAKKAFSQFLVDSKYNATQIQFINEIIEYLTVHGAMEVSRLYASPYTEINPMSLDGLFTSADASAIAQILQGIQTVYADGAWLG